MSDVEKPERLWHGAPKKIIGALLLPRKASDLKNSPENTQFAVYAADNEDAAIIVALLKSDGVTRGSFDFSIPRLGVVFEGWPKQDNIYIYELPSKTFRQAGRGGGQWVSSEAVRPLGVEEIPVEAVIDLIRKPTEEERADYERRYEVKLKQ